MSEPAPQRVLIEYLTCYAKYPDFELNKYKKLKMKKLNLSVAFLAKMTMSQAQENEKTNN